MIDLRDRATLECLLGRPERAVLTDEDRRRLAGRRILITGAGGSVGSELARLVATCGPERIILADHGEHNLVCIERELAERWPDAPVEPALVDITRPRSLLAGCRTWRPHVIYHAAAYKHVTMAERAVCAAARTNVLGTLAVMKAAAAAGSPVVLVSTDKAAQPRSVMGATKRLAELVATAAPPGSHPPVVVRFGNVLGSSGSLVPIMLDRIREGRPVAITDRDATRYFMSASEAASLVLKAGLDGEPGAIHWLDVGSAVRIVDLALSVIRMAAAAGYGPVPIEIIGLRPGEKLREDLVSQGLGLRPTRHPCLWVTRQMPVDPAGVARALGSLRLAVAREDAAATLAALCAAVPEYEPSADARDRAMRAAPGWRPRPVAIRPLPTPPPLAVPPGPAVTAVRRRPAIARWQHQRVPVEP